MGHSQTKQALIALNVNELAREYAYDAITVDMICERSQISRSGFYRAFEDKYAVLTWCERFPLDQGLAQIGRTLTIAQGIKVAFEAFGFFWDMFESTAKSTERHQREYNGIHRTHEQFCETITQWHNIELDSELNYQALWAARGTLHAIRERRDLDPNFPDSSKLIASCYPPRLAKIFDAPLHPTEYASFNVKSLILSE